MNIIYMNYVYIGKTLPVAKVFDIAAVFRSGLHIFCNSIKHKKYTYKTI